jgi:hypothetical protein
MAAQMQNPGGQAGASREDFGGQAGTSSNQLDGWLHFPCTGSDWQAQMLASRFCLSPWLASDMAWLCFGEGRRND